MSDQDANSKNTLYLYISMLVMLITGAGNTILLKLQIEVRDNNGNRYKHPYFSSVDVFIAGSLGLVLFSVYKYLVVKKHGSFSNSPDVINAVQSGKKEYIHWIWLVIPAFCNFCAIPLMNLGLIMINASVYQMMRGGLIFITAVSAIIFLKARLHRHHWTALTAIIMGVTLVGLSSVLGTNSKNSNIVLGICLLLISQFFSATHWIIEEKILKTHYIHPFRMVGWQGIWSLLMTTIMVIIANFIKCDAAYCSDGRLENVPLAITQMREKPIIIMYLILLIICICAFQCSGVYTTKYGSSAQRCTIDIARIILIWGFFLAYPGEGHESFEYIEFIGFIGIIIGTIIYNEIYVPPILGFAQNTKANKAKRDKQNGQFTLMEEDMEDAPDAQLPQKQTEVHLNGSSDSSTKPFMDSVSNKDS
ncbi:unnamed protein product [Moneuplotes crassus]|uniref:Uncharacterized protein n=1 Tax=Euplotes crassus TaxID=5936 RepID=A0AAD1UKQ0_EUPCR|nr:unnamed protein product [Moneuplotes crassus]